MSRESLNMYAHAVHVIASAHVLLVGLSVSWLVGWLVDWSVSNLVSHSVSSLS